MSITKNVGGVLRNLKEITVNDGGVLRNLKEVTECKGGVLRKIFSKASSDKLTWLVDTSIAYYDKYSKIVSVSDDGLTIEYISKTPNDLKPTSGSSYDWGVPCICSNKLALKAGTTIKFTTNSISGSGTSVDIMYIFLVDADGEEAGKSVLDKAGEGSPITVPADGEYHLRLGGNSVTIKGSQSGTSYTYYGVTVNCTISFS